MNKITQFLNKPVLPTEDGWPELLRNSIMTGIVVILILWILQPFGIQPGSIWEWMVILGFGVVTAIMLIFSEAVVRKGLERSFGRFDQVKKVFLWNVILILLVAIGNFVYHGFLNPGGNNFTLEIFGIFLYRTFALGVIPFLLVYAFFLQQKSRQFQIQANELSEKLTQTQEKPSEIVLEGQGKNEILKLQADQILYIQSTDNYATIFFLQNGEIARHLLRASLSSLASQLSETNLQRCHRSYIVNTTQIIKADSATNGLILSLNDSKEKLPVSRKYVEAIRGAMS